MEMLQQLEEENRRLRKAVDELSILNELARVISSTMSLESLIENLVKRSVRAVHGQQGMITLVNEVAPTEMKTLIRALDSTTDHQQFHLNQNILGWMMINKKPLLSNDLGTDPRFTGAKVEGDLRSLLCVPLLVKSRLIGILAVFNKKETADFSDDDKRLLSIIAAQSAQVLENARLYEEEQKKMMMEKELFAAREVQMNLLPKEVPQIPHFAFAALTVPAQEIGGDFYDFIKLDNQSYEIVVADVAGKGLPAALLATMGKGILYSQALEHRSPQHHAQQSNKILRGSIPRKSFITMLLAVIEPDSRSITVANAGHCYPVLYHAATKKAEMLSIKGMPLNFTDNILCQECTLPMEPEDALIFYSDGVSEAANARQEMYGVERLQEAVQRFGSESADQLLKRINDEIKFFAGTTPQNDDITLIVIKATE